MMSVDMKATSSKSESGKAAERRMTNTEKFAGGRGTASGVERSEKRGNGRLRTSKITSNLGPVKDLSRSGCRLVFAPVGKKTPKPELESIVKLELSAEDVSLQIDGEVMWLRVLEDRSIAIGLRFSDITQDQRRTLLDLMRTGVANDGLSRGWSPMAGFLETERWRDE